MIWYDFSDGVDGTVIPIVGGQKYFPRHVLSPTPPHTKAICFVQDIPKIECVTYSSDCESPSINSPADAEGTLEALRSLTPFASKTDGVYKQGQDKAQVVGDSLMFQVRTRSKNISDNETDCIQITMYALD